jgi:hypothetical protein
VAERTEHAAGTALGNERWEAERTVGATMSLEEAVAYALEPTAYPDAQRELARP